VLLVFSTIEITLELSFHDVLCICVNCTRPMHQAKSMGYIKVCSTEDKDDGIF
jgi:hypothetical protein